MSLDFVVRAPCMPGSTTARPLLLPLPLPLLLVAALSLTGCGASGPAPTAPADAPAPGAPVPTSVAATPPVTPALPHTPPAAGSEADFAQMLAGFHQCRYDGLFVNDLPGQPATAPDTAWFRAHPAAACGRDDDFYYFCMDERYHGLDVQRMALPGAGGIPSVALYLKQDLATAQRMLRAALGSDFQASAASDAGKAPLLVEDPAHAGGSVLVCTRDF